MKRLIAVIFACLCAVAIAQTSSPASGPTSRPTSRPGGEIVPPPRRDVPGDRLSLDVGELYVPAFFSPGEKIDVVLWSLGAPWCVEQCFYDARRNAVLLTVNTSPRTKTLDELLLSISNRLRDEKIADKPIGRICLGSFSGGYTFTRAILRDASSAARVTDVVLADSLYAPRKDDTLDDAAMKPFLDFAMRTADGKTTFVFSHLYPPEEKYRNNTTTLAAIYLRTKLKIPASPGTGRSSRGAKILYRADKENLHIFGYAGMTNQDHFDHFYGMADLLLMTSLVPAPQP